MLINMFYESKYIYQRVDVELLVEHSADVQRIVPFVNCTDSMTRVRLRFDDGFVVKFVSQPKMMHFDLFYEAGGIVSLWFGLTILDGVWTPVALVWVRFKRAAKRLFETTGEQSDVLDNGDQEREIVSVKSFISPYLYLHSL